jgi:hypothetical protein
MGSDERPFERGAPWSGPIRDLGLTIAGSDLEPVLAEFEGELRRAGVTRVRPRFYLSTEWGVPEGTVAVAIPFYLARTDLTAEHARRTGHVEGAGAAEILRYLRHEMGHVVNYAYRLYESPGWVEHFGPIARPYVEDYRPRPFSRDFVRHLPGWYAQKHPDEDWAETFAVWMTPGLDWRAEYADWPVARAKLDYCDRIMAALAGLDPVVTDDATDLDVGEIDRSLDEYYVDLDGDGVPDPIPPGLDGALRSIFEGPARPGPDAGRRPASALIARFEAELIADVYRWTGHFPERTRPLLLHLAARADSLGLGYPADREPATLLGLTCFLTVLAMNYVTGGSYAPDAPLRPTLGP